MNYEERIAALKAKGILDEADVSTLRSTLKEKTAAVPKRRSYLLETVGLLFVGTVVVYLVLQVGTLENASNVEEVSRTLNASRTGVSASHTLLLLLAGFFAATLLGTYLLAHHCYNHLWWIEEQRIATGALIADLEVRQFKTAEKLQRYISQEHSGEKAVKTAMQITATLDRELGEMQAEYAGLQAACRQKRGAFPCKLATLVGNLPACL